MISRPALRWAWVMFVGLALGLLVVVPFRVRVDGVGVKCGAPAIAISVPDVPERCRPPATLRLAAAVAVLALGTTIAALASRRDTLYRYQRKTGPERPTPMHPREAS